MKELYRVRYNQVISKWDTIVRPPDERLSFRWINSKQNTEHYADRVQVFRGNELIVDASPQTMYSFQSESDVIICGIQNASFVGSYVAQDEQKYFSIVSIPDEYLRGHYRAIGSLIDITTDYGQTSACYDYIALLREEE